MERTRRTGAPRVARARSLLATALLLLAACKSGGGGGSSGTGGAGGGTTTPGTIQLSAAAYGVTEGAGVVHLVITRTGGSDGGVSVTLTSSDGTATAPGDYAAVSATVTFAAGDTAAKTVDVAIVDDNVVEPLETFAVTLSAPTGGATLGVPATATISIQDDDLPSTAGGSLNDTGVTRCATAAASGLDCGSSAAGTDLFPRQDAESGRDLTANDDRDGHAGFSFTKLDAAGTAVPDQTVAYAVSPWPCVLDRVTGLTWEVRTSDGGLRDSLWTYSWFATSLPQGSPGGTPSGGACAPAGTCDTEQYQAAVNGAALCGFRDWRLPSRAELLGLVDYGAPVAPFIDTAFFPDAVAGAYWSATPHSRSGSWALDLSTGLLDEAGRSLGLSVRLVRGGGQQ
jgi:hypothetical protein